LCATSTWATAPASSPAGLDREFVARRALPSRRRPTDLDDVRTAVLEAVGYHARFTHPLAGLCPRRGEGRR
jgi:hypothetical protein